MGESDSVQARAACLAGAAAVVVLVDVIVRQATRNCSEPQRVELGFRSPGSQDLCFEVCFLHFVSFRACCECGRPGKEVHGMETYWQWVSAARLTSTEPRARNFGGALSHGKSGKLQASSDPGFRLSLSQC